MPDDLLKPVELPEPVGRVFHDEGDESESWVSTSAAYTADQLTARDAIYLSRIAKLIEERDAANASTKQALALCASVADQQAYPDDSWKREAAAIAASIGAAS
jgi:hypothetical protein